MESSNASSAFKVAQPAGISRRGTKDGGPGARFSKVEHDVGSTGDLALVANTNRFYAALSATTVSGPWGLPERSGHRANRKNKFPVGAVMVMRLTEAFVLMV